MCFTFRPAGCMRSSGLSLPIFWLGGARGLRIESKRGRSFCFLRWPLIGEEYNKDLDLSVTRSIKSIYDTKPSASIGFLIIVSVMQRLTYAGLLLTIKNDFDLIPNAATD